MTLIRRPIYFRDSETMKYDLLIVTSPVEPPGPLKDSEFVWTRNMRFLETSPHGLEEC
ncbi:hypothetical protein [Hyperthermus butylicus]|uniref:hypothetical protein n=1 Tax=Hyperthermus butylicus TaxID=54248 RepID=UPI00129A4CC8|nr:hypothetical protein [Hyperthermus butylicus]